MAASRGSTPPLYGVALVGLVALQPFVGFANRNRSQISQTGRLWMYALLFAAASVGALALVLRRWGRDDPNRTAVVVAAVVASFLNFSALFDPNPSNRAKLVGVLLVWVLLTLALARVAYLVGSSGSVRFGLLVFVSMMVVLPAVPYVAYSVGSEPLIAIEDPGVLAAPNERPNVYWIVLDGYARTDTLARVVGHDNRPFVAGLEERGFQVSQTSRTSYPRTHLSMASTLQMDYVLEPGDEVTDDFTRFAPVVVGHNRTVARFEALGYHTVYGPAGGLEWSACRSDLVDVCLPTVHPSPATGELEQSLLNLTPLGVVQLPVPYADPLTFVDGLAASHVEEPFFALQHIMTPHDPYRYREDCTPRAVPLNRRSLSGPDQIKAYTTQVRCISALVTEAVDRIVARDPNAVIIVQSDHGTDFEFTWKADPEELTSSQLSERFSAFNAMRLPRRCGADIEGQPLVNTFRIVFACLEGTEPELLDYRAFTQPLAEVTALTELSPERFEG